MPSGEFLTTHKRNREPTDQSIHTVAVRRLGVCDTSIYSMRDGDRIKGFEWWFGLSVRVPGDPEWKPLGRRRTKMELLEMVGTFDPRHIDGVTFGGTAGGERPRG